ncbi:MAG: hypothetical protein KBD10_02515 [Candidatus Pacebacteria bacterium]|nr:hypothetical protein [Candidatus Paceibacterota bacterium]
MNESFSQSNQERNLALERQEAVKKHNDLLKEYESMPDEDKNWNQNTSTTNNPETGKKNSEMLELRKNVGNIDKYRELATSKENLTSPEIGDISDVEKMKQEKEKVDKEVEKITRDIERTKSELNELRKKLNLPETDDIPSLSDKKQKLENLLVIKNDLDGQLDFEIKKQEAVKNENTENQKMEQHFLKNSLEEVSSSLKRVSGIIDERQSQGFQDIFSNPAAFRYIASGLEDFSDNEELKTKLSKLGNIVEDFARPSLNDHPDSMRELASKLSQLEASLRELPSKIKNEEERQEFGGLVYSVASKVDEAVSFIRRKAGQLEEARNF